MCTGKTAQTSAERRNAVEHRSVTCERSIGEKALSSKSAVWFKRSSAVFCLLDAALDAHGTSLGLADALECCEAPAAKNDRGEKAEEITGSGCGEKIWASSMARMCSRREIKPSWQKVKRLGAAINGVFLQTGWRNTIQVDRFKKPQLAFFVQSRWLCNAREVFSASQRHISSRFLPQLSQIPEKRRNEQF